MVYSIIVSALVSYLLGNLNGAVCMSALMHDDVRAHGSGNAGLTNFIRNYGQARALYVVLIDAGKAYLACLTSGLLLMPYDLALEGVMIGGMAVILGHVFPALLGFKGGKGILSGLFVALAADWRIAVLILAVFLVVYLATKIVSLGSVLAAITFGIGSALAAVAAYLMLMKAPSLTSTLGAMPGIKAFTAAVLGGIGSIPGAMLGGILLGLVECISYKITAIAPYTDAIEFSILIIILLVRPTGFLGKKRREKV